MRKIALGTLAVFAIFGVYLTGIFAHEAFHVAHADGKAKSVCLDFNLKMNDEVQSGYLTAHTEFDVNGWSGVQEFNTWRELSEKYAAVLETILFISLSFGLGILFARMW